MRDPVVSKRPKCKNSVVSGQRALRAGDKGRGNFFAVLEFHESSVGRASGKTLGTAPYCSAETVSVADAPASTHPRRKTTPAMRAQRQHTTDQSSQMLGPVASRPSTEGPLAQH